ncbi:MAG: LicD family protein [Clostridium lundense]|nr:LicD family protein [Clostridium lundense]
MIPALRRLQLVELTLLLELKRICDKHNIKYFLIGGTLLGAVRHEGFIPWDDDIDVGMLRDDYERFLDVCSDELPPEIFLQTCKTERNYNRSFARLRLNGTHVGDFASRTTDCHSGILIDIFPFDSKPDNRLLMLLHKFTINVFFVIGRCKSGDTVVGSTLGRFAYIIGLPLSKLMSIETIYNIRDHLLKRYNSKPTKQVWNYPFYCHDKTDFTTTTDVEFETIQFKAPVNYIHFLEEAYGDWQTLPPEDKRTTGHEFSGIDFGEYSYISSIEDVLNHNLHRDNK